MHTHNHNSILIIDFGSQYTQLIARRVREFNVFCEILPFDCTSQDIQNISPKGIILSGGPESVLGELTPRAPEQVFKQGCPVLGICYGMQTMAHQLGGKVSSSEIREFGYAQLTLQGHSALLSQIEDKVDTNAQALLDVWMSHGDKVDALPPNFISIAKTKDTPFAAMADEARHFYGLQFHPEVTHTKQGKHILERFVINICECSQDWTADNIIEENLATIRETVGTDHVVLGLSGGVDSSVVAALLNKAIGDQLTCVFVDTGLLRLDEGDSVMQIMADHMGIHVIRVDAQDYFLNELKGVADPEQKRKIIGRCFIDIFEQEAKKITNAAWLAQGTIYSDVIESAGNKLKKGHVIKSHHNVGGLPERMSLKLLEPLRELFKDEVRQLGLELGLPANMIYRHPFPGPGLGVRILGEVKQEYVEILRKADAIFIHELVQAQLYDKVSQAFAVFLPVKSVAVMGDARQYDYVIALRAVETHDFMTAHWAHLPYEFLSHVSNRIMNEVKGISRVTYDISGKPPATIEWE